MCGLAGVLLRSQPRSAAVWDAIREHFTQNLIANEKRGRDAAGVALITRDGEYLIHKDDVPASELVQTARYREILAQVGAGTACLLGHTRLPTKGSTDNMLNNHPIVTGNIIGAHNGRIENDDQVFNHFHFLRRGQVDSEIIFTLLDHLSPRLLAKTYLQHAANVMGVLQGPMAVLAVDLRCPERLVVVKDGSPLAYHYQEDWGAMTFSSRYLFLRKAFGRAVLRETLDRATVAAFHTDHLPHPQIRSLERLQPPPALSYLRERRW